MKRYVSTVILSDDLQDALVILKDHGPEHLIGKLNAIGGKIEPGESLYEAAVREIKEEAGLSIDKRMLDFLGNLADNNYTWDVAVFVLTLTPDEMGKAWSMTSEGVIKSPVISLLQLPEVDTDFRHMLYEALRFKSRQTLYDGSRGIRFSTN